MHRLLCAAALCVAVAATTGTASAEPDCTYAGHNNTRLALCTEYVCVDICAPEWHIDPQCSVDIEPPSLLVERACASVDGLYLVIP